MIANPSTVRPGSCPVHEVPEPTFSVYRAPPTSPPTIVQQAVQQCACYWCLKNRKEKQ